jgi:hypothetical protein
MLPEPASLTLQDVADLARVRRPVVSMWRNRPLVRGEAVPFPAPVATVDGVQRFDREQVVAWLERTRRGNNAEHRLDAPAVAVPDDLVIRDVVTLLTWHVMTGDELAGSSQQSRVTAARAVDPGDELLLREVDALRPSEATLRFVDDLVEASYGAADALDRLYLGRLGRQRGDRGLAPEAFAILRACCRAGRASLNRDDVPLLHTGDVALSLAMAGEHSPLVVQGDDASARQVRREATIRGLEVTSQLTSPHLRVLPLLGRDVRTVLDRLEDLVLGLDRDDLLVVLGPASVLCDRLAGDQDQLRSATLRTGHVVLAARLSRGLWREAPRQSLGLWVCRGRADEERPRVADLAAFPPEEWDLDDLTDDVAAALAGGDGRGFRYARSIELASVLAGGALVPHGVRAPRLRTPDGSSITDRIHEATLVTSEPLRTLDVLVSPAPGDVQLRSRSLGQLEADGALRMRRGSRIDEAHTDTAGTVSVHSAEGPVEGFTLDPFDAARLYPRAVRTEPGDVVLAERPRPRAWVDPTGGSLVASPARLIRLEPAAGVGPHVLAAVVNHLCHEGTEWRSWSVPTLRPAQSGCLEAALVDIDAYTAQLERRLDAADRLRTALVQGVAAGTVTLPTEPQTTRTTDQEKA